MQEGDPAVSPTLCWVELVFSMLQKQLATSGILESSLGKLVSLAGCDFLNYRHQPLEGEQTPTYTTSHGPSGLRTKLENKHLQNPQKHSEH